MTRANDEIRRELARRLGLGVNDMTALDHLLQDGPLGPAELGSLLGMRSASATALVDRLEAVGHVERRAHPTDRRRLVVEPTPHAVEEVLGVIRPLVAGIDAVAEELSPEEQRVVLGYLSRVTSILRDYDADDPDQAVSQRLPVSDTSARGLTGEPVAPVSFSGEQKNRKL